MSKKIHGRGATDNTSGRFEHAKIEIEVTDDSVFQDEDPKNLSPQKIKTQFFKDSSRSIVVENDSPDVGARYSMNFYRGCEHGCAYCYARPTHEYLGMSAGLDFESKIFVKQNAPELLRQKLMSQSWDPEAIQISGVTDCYQPAERFFQLTRQCLEVLLEFRNPAVIITKNALVTRDIDILKQMAQHQLILVILSITTLDAELARQLEPRTSTPAAKLKAIEELSAAGISVGVNVAPVIPGLTDHEMPAILKAAREAGAEIAGYTALRLPYSVSDIFSNWLKANRPLAKVKILQHIREMRDGKLNDANFNSRMRGVGVKADQIEKMFDLFSKKYRFNEKRVRLDPSQFRRPGDQLSLF